MVVTRDLTGNRYVNLVAKTQGEDHIIKSSGMKMATWICDCDCGSETTILAASLISGNSIRCKLCVRKHTGKLTNIYGDFHRPTRNSWYSMVGRCTNPKTPSYKMYGGAGVVVCDRWLEESPKGYFNFLEDMGGTS